MINAKLGVDLKIRDSDLINPDSGGIVLNNIGDLDLINDIALVRQALIVRLNTRQGDLWSHPQYGNPVYDILSDLMTPDWFARAITGITDCINDEPRAQCINVSYTAVPQERRVEFAITYKIIDGRIDNLIWNYSSEEVINNV